MLFVKRALLPPEFATVASSAIVESPDDSASHWDSEPDSKSSLKYVPGARPRPDRTTCCGLSAASSDTVSDPARAPVADGENVTRAVQLAPAANAAGAIGQSLVAAKSGLPSTPVMSSGAAPVFVTVTACSGLLAPTVSEPKVSVVALRPTDATGMAVAVPPTVTDCGESGALSSRVSSAALSPPECGAKTTSTVQLAPAGRPAFRSHVVVREKSPAARPARVIDERASVALPVFVNVTV